jgi:hypothetical protein
MPNTGIGSATKPIYWNGSQFVAANDYPTTSSSNHTHNEYLLRGNLTQGSWNPRGTNLAVDWNYNGGDMSISESGGQISVSIDGLFYQGEGAYRVLDTRDFNGSIAWSNVSGRPFEGA